MGEIRDYAFIENDNIKSVIITNGVTGIGDSAFCGCQNLTDVTISDTVVKIGTAAFARSALKNISIPASVENFGVNAFYETEWLKNKRAENPMIIVNGVLIDGKKCSGDINIPSGVEVIGECAFSGCNFITSVTMSDSVKEIRERAFEDCLQLVSVKIGDSVKNIDEDAFRKSPGLKNVVFSDSVENIGSNAFEGTKWLTNKSKSEQLVIVNGMLIDAKRCMGDVVIPDTVTKIKKSAFAYSRLTSLTIPDSVKVIESSAFISCASLRTVKLPANITSIEKWTFGECSSLESISIPDSVTSIGASAFYECKNLKTVTVPASVESIDYAAFAMCEKLENITILNPECRINDYDNTICSDYDPDKLYSFKGTICGLEGSTAYMYAGMNRYKFESIGVYEGEISYDDYYNLSVTMWGDANDDGSLNIADVVILNRSLNDPLNFMEDQEKVNADVYEPQDVTGRSVDPEKVVLTAADSEAILALILKK